MSLILATRQARGKRRGENKDTGTLPLVGAIQKLAVTQQDLVKEGRSRAVQIRDLCAVAQVVKAVLHRVTMGSLTQESLNVMMPPAIHPELEGGTSKASEYIRDILVETREVVTTLHVENAILKKRVREIEIALNMKDQGDQATSAPTTFMPLPLSSLTEILSELEE